MSDIEYNWEEFVRSEVSALFDSLLPASVSGNIHIKYKNLVIAQTEGGPEYDTTKASGVDIVLSFDFANPVDKKQLIVNM